MRILINSRTAAMGSGPYRDSPASNRTSFSIDPVRKLTSMGRNPSVRTKTAASWGDPDLALPGVKGDSDSLYVGLYTALRHVSHCQGRLTSHNTTTMHLHLPSGAARYTRSFPSRLGPSICSWASQ